MTALREKVERSITGWQVPILGDEKLGGQPLIHELWTPSNPRIAVGNEGDYLFFYRESKQDRQFFTMQELPGKLISCPSYLEILNDPIIHEGSSSRYKWQMEIGQDVLLGGFLPPNEWTSNLHWHKGETKDSPIDQPAQLVKPPIVEWYELSYGTATIHFVEGDKGIEAPEFFVVRPGVRHRMESGPDGAFFSIRMQYAALYSPEERHTHF